MGWLLGVEDLPEPPGEAAGTETALTEQQLRMVEEIASRYIAAQPKPRKRRRWPFVAAGLILCLVLFHLFDRLGRMDDQYADLQNSVYRVESSVNGQIGSLSSRVEEILKAQNDLTADYATQLVSADLAEIRCDSPCGRYPRPIPPGCRWSFWRTVAGRSGRWKPRRRRTELLPGRWSVP